MQVIHLADMMERKISILINLIFFSGILLYSCKKSETTPAFYVVREISYGSDTMNKMDLYLCENYNGTTPLVIIIHGGGWVTGDKSSLVSFAEGFAGNGIITASINYRYPNDSSRVHYKEVLDDIGAAASKLLNLADEYHFRKTGFSIFGHSSGGHLSLLYAYRNNNSLLVQNVIAYDPVTDLTDTALESVQGMKDLIRTVVGDSSIEAYRDASPFYLAGSGSVTTLCFHGTRDEIFPYQQSVKLIRKLDSLHIPCKLIPLENSPHFSNGDFPFVLSETTAFIKQMN